MEQERHEIFGVALHPGELRQIVAEDPSPLVLGKGGVVLPLEMQRRPDARRRRRRRQPKLTRRTVRRAPRDGPRREGGGGHEDGRDALRGGGVQLGVVREREEEEARGARRRDAVGESSSILQQRLREEAEEGRRAFGFHGVGEGFGRGGALGEVEHRALVSDEDGGDGAERESPRAHGSADGRGVALGPDEHVEDEEDEREENRSVDESVPMRELGDVRVDGARRARAARGGRSGVDDKVENSRHGLHDEGGQDGLDAERLQVQDVKPKPSLDEHVEVAGCRRPTTTVPSVHVPNRPHEATESVGYPPRDTRGRSPERRFFAHWPTSTARRSPRPRTRRQCAESCPRTV